MSDVLCMRTGCKNFAIYTVSAHVWAMGHTKKSAPAEMNTSLAICTEHSNIKFEDVFPAGEGRTRVDDQFKKVGKALPNWNTGELVLRPITRGIPK